MVKCVFCGRDEQHFKGVHVIHNDGSVSYFCSGKCRRNAFKLKRDKRKLKWTSAYLEIKKKAKEKAKTQEVKIEETSKSEIKSEQKKGAKAVKKRAK